MNLNEELYRIQDLMMVSRKILMEAKAPTPTVQGNCLNLVDYSKPFSAAEAGTEQRAQEFINGILGYVKVNIPDLYTKWVNGSKLSISNSTLIGCASNRVKSDRDKKYIQYSSAGGRPVLPTMDNNYVVTTYNKDSYNQTLDSNGIPNLDYPEYDVFFEDDLKYAEDRVNNLWAMMKGLLEKNRIVFKTDPKIEKHIVDTGGRIDENRDKSSYPNPGQVVLFNGTICEYKPELVPDIAKVECIQNVKIEYNYDEVVEAYEGHCCSRGLFNIFANGIKLSRTDGKDYASINNAPDSGTGNMQSDTRAQTQALGLRKTADGTKDICYTEKNKNAVISVGNQTRDKYNNSKDSKPGNYRYNTFVISSEQATSIVNTTKGEPGFLTITANPYKGNTNPHKEAVRVTIYNPQGTLLYDSCEGGECTGGAYGPWKVNFCSASSKK